MTVSTNAIQKTAPLPALNALPPKFCENMSPPQFFTGRSLRPAGIGIEAPVVLDAKFLQLHLSCSGKNSQIRIVIQISSKIQWYADSETSHPLQKFQEFVTNCRLSAKFVKLPYPFVICFFMNHLVLRIIAHPAPPKLLSKFIVRSYPIDRERHNYR